MAKKTIAPTKKDKKSDASLNLDELLVLLQGRFEQHTHRHPSISWTKVEKRLEAAPEKLGTLLHMELSGGEPDVVELRTCPGKLVFVDCSAESPLGRRSLCYDRAALDARKEHKPEGSVVEHASTMGAELLSEEHYRALQEFGPFDTKTSSWILTPAPIRALDGALFADYRYDHVFVYHNGAQSYYAARGYRSLVRL